MENNIGIKRLKGKFN